jgi:hypothetical protein
MVVEQIRQLDKDADNIIALQEIKEAMKDG